MLYSDRVLSEVESIQLRPRKARFEVEGLDVNRPLTEKGFEMAPALGERVNKEQERKMRLAIHDEQIKYAKQLMKERRRKATTSHHLWRCLVEIANHPFIMSKGREMVFLFLITGVIFQVGIIAHTMGLIGR